MSKRRKLLIILGLIALAAVCITTLWPRDEPKYQGRYLSDWVALYGRHYYDQTSPEFVEAQTAVQTIGTNGLPHFLEWMRYEPPPWRISLRKLKRPSWIAGNRTVGRLLYGPLLRVESGYIGLVRLGTNAFVAMPELKAMMGDRTKPLCAQAAMRALIEFGEPAIPIFQATLADPHQPDRGKILEDIGLMASKIDTNNTYLPIFVTALTNDNKLVREEAMNIVSRIAPQFLTNTPAN